MLEVLIGVASFAAFFALAYWYIEVYSPRKHMREAIIEVNAMMARQQGPRRSGPRQPVCDGCPGPHQRESCAWCADTHGVREAPDLTKEALRLCKKARAAAGVRATVACTYPDCTCRVNWDSWEGCKAGATEPPSPTIGSIDNLGRQPELKPSPDFSDGVQPSDGSKP